MLVWVWWWGRWRGIRTNNPNPPSYRPGVVSKFSILQNDLDVSHEKLFSGQLPTRVVVGLVTNRAFNDRAENDQFYFCHLNSNEIALHLDGQQQHTIRPMHCSRVINTEVYIKPMIVCLPEDEMYAKTKDCLASK